MFIIGALLIIAGIMCMVEGHNQKKERERQNRFNNATYGLFTEHKWVEKRTKD